MIEPVMVEVPNPAHPYGAQGVMIKGVRHCERSEAISATAHRPGVEIAASPFGLLAMTGS
jgi:hypothetical protein